MTIDEAKLELVKRYQYLYENAVFILAPYMYQEKFEEIHRLDRKSRENADDFVPMIYLKFPVDKICWFEEFLLFGGKMEASFLYKFVETARGDKEYLEKVREGCLLLDKKNDGVKYLKTTLSIWNILGKVWNCILEQSGDLRNKENKLHVLDEYYRMARYCNDGKIRTSGHNSNLHDFNSLIIPKYQRKPSRNKDDIGVKSNEFIQALRKIPCYEDNLSIFLESEKQEIYLKYHDELPWDLEITCSMEERYEDDICDSRLSRPEHTNCCGKDFYINESEIFVDFDDEFYRYYQLCPHCGYIVNIPKELLTDGIRERIENRCRNDIHLFRKMILFSELKQLDDISVQGQKKLLKR